MVSSFSASCSWRPLDWRIRHSYLSSTLFHSLVPWWRPRRIRPQITRLSQLENSAMGTWPIYKNSIIPDWFEKWRDIKFWYRCVVPQNYDVCPLLMMHKTCSINYGHLTDLQKTLPTTDLNKKNFHLIKYLLATFIFFLSFQSVLVTFWFSFVSRVPILAFLSSWDRIFRTLLIWDN